jgi:hypothetical protein
LKPKSDNLFHFTKSLDILKSILTEGIKPRLCLEDQEWFHQNGEDYAGFGMSCFCDIPLSRISEHTDFYGSFGIGLTKAWGIKNQLNPIVYCPPSGHIAELARGLLDWNPDDEQEYAKSSLHFFRLTSLIKPIIGKMVIAGNIVEKEFYQENEWRYVPEFDRAVGQDNYDEVKDEFNKELEEYSLKFSPQDIRYIFVPSDNDIPALVDFINNNLGAFPLNDLKVLQSRIVSLETLSIDL